jgi:hypothetical protein
VHRERDAVAVAGLGEAGRGSGHPRSLADRGRFEWGKALTNFDGSPPDAFWVISMTFDSDEAMHAAFASEAGQKTVGDMPNYKARSRVSVVSEVQ